MARGNQAQNQASFAPVMNNRAIPEASSGPFFLHNGDHPGLVLVSHPLTGTSYNTWSRAMLMALTAKNKLLFVDGSYPRPQCCMVLGIGAIAC